MTDINHSGVLYSLSQESDSAKSWVNGKSTQCCSILAFTRFSSEIMNLCSLRFSKVAVVYIPRNRKRFSTLISENVFAKAKQNCNRIICEIQVLRRKSVLSARYKVKGNSEHPSLLAKYLVSECSFSSNLQYYCRITIFSLVLYRAFSYFTCYKVLLNKMFAIVFIT